ncbi:glycosyltransferase [Solibacillus isronensis]|uniref:glycosyltransferase n=1 Tax=Solibacillus isronensis TaxID=412383 RepID=UPI00399EED3D
MKKVKEKLTEPVEDHHILSNLLIPTDIHTSIDKRGLPYLPNNFNPIDSNHKQKYQLLRIRYRCGFDVLLIKNSLNKPTKKKFHSENISITGILIKSNESQNLQIGEEVTLRFKIPEGTMPEGFESKIIINAKVIRVYTEETQQGISYYIALQFIKTLDSYLTLKRWRLTTFIAGTLLIFIFIVVLLMRAESVIYFQFNKTLYLYSIIAAALLLSRYFFSIFYRNVKINPHFEPGVSIIIPVFNEEEWIRRTISTAINQDYPVDKLEVIVIDDHSTDKTVENIIKVVHKIHTEGKQFNTKERLKYHVLSKNSGKRVALITGVKMAKFDLVVFVDSDSFLEPNAIHNIVQPFQDPKIGGISGRTEVENKFTNTLTKFQAVRYYIAFRIMKAAESIFDSVTCLSGPLSCYRKELVLKNSDAWITQKFLGQPATFGDDRSMTNFILKTHRTGYQDNAVCSTIVPSNTRIFLKQQMRWKRSWLRESLRAIGFIWKKEPFMSFFFLAGLIVPIAAPIVVIYNLLYVPIFLHVFPTTFLMGLLLMALLLSFAHLLFRRSNLWTFGIIFVLFYECILLWQMPIAWFTFWKSEWGTRDTPQDMEALEKKIRKRQSKKTS